MMVGTGTDRLLTVWSLISVYTSIFSAQPDLAVGATQCLTVDLVKVQCLATTSTASIICPVNYNVEMRAAAIYKSKSSCQSTPVSDACWHSNITELVNMTCHHNESNCLLTLPAPTSPLHCSLATHPGDYFAVIDYRCQPVFRTNPATTTAWTIYISSSLVRTSALVEVANDIFGSSTGIYLYSTTDYCSIHVPGDTEAIITLSRLDTTSVPSSDCQQRFLLSQWNSNQTFQLCRSDVRAAPIRLDCAADGMDRYFTLRYVNDYVTVGALFFVDIQVSAWSAVTVQCGTPPVPLNVTQPPTTITTRPAMTITTTARTTPSDVPPQPDVIAIVVSVAVIVGVLIVSVVVGLIYRRRRQQQQSAPTKRANGAMMVGRARPASYVQHGSYVQPRTPQYADGDRYKHVVNFYMNGDQRSSLVLDRHRPTPFYRTVLRY